MTLAGVHVADKGPYAAPCGRHDLASRADPRRGAPDCSPATASTASPSTGSARPSGSAGRRSTGTSRPRRACSPRCWSASASTCSPAGRSARPRTADPEDLLDALVDFHADFALQPARADHRAGPRPREPPRRRPAARPALQRAYVEIWVDALRRADPSLGEEQARVRAHGAFGLMNSTPRSAAHTPWRWRRPNWWP